ncbi:MAG: hypothetical protein EOO43_08865 [Flavobacterium sp.]|nr:MAG: hypothetical protein EOO43_08865 [Flavobacterium sp.]
MLNLDNPRTEIIFKASAYIDKIKMMCTVYPLQEFGKREDTFLDAQVLCEEFIKFCEANYTEHCDEMVATINLIKAETERLQAINIETEPGHCKLCNGNLTGYKSSIKEFGTIYNCDTCPTLIYQYANDLEMYSGAWMI